MADEKEIKKNVMENEKVGEVELTDDELGNVAGGYFAPPIVPRSCPYCGRQLMGELPEHVANCKKRPNRKGQHY